MTPAGLAMVLLGLTVGTLAMAGRADAARILVFNSTRWAVTTTRRPAAAATGRPR